MRTRVATLVALVVVACAQARGQSPTPAIAGPGRNDPLSLDAAFARVERNHPLLAAFRPAREALDAEARQAALRPALRLGADLENALGSGAQRGFDGSEITVGLGSVFESAGKREARVAVVERRRDALASAEDARRLDLLAEVARRYLDLVAAQAEERIADSDLVQRERTVTAAKRRVDAGASPTSALLAAQANLARAGLDRERARRLQSSAYRRLALLWGERGGGGQRVPSDALQIPAVPAFDELDDLLETTPELRRFADEERLREARVQLARRQTTSDIEWNLGLRRLQASDDWGLVGSVSIPLGARARAASTIRAAEAELDALQYERAAGVLDLRSTLIEAHGRLEARVLEARQLQDAVIPRFADAEAAAETAYRSGALSQLEWAQLQADTTGMRRQLLAASVDAQRALIEIQRLTGRAFGAVPSAPASERP